VKRNTERDEEIVRMKQEGRTIKEIAAFMGLTSQRIEQICKAARTAGKLERTPTGPREGSYVGSTEMRALRKLARAHQEEFLRILFEETTARWNGV
jgi:predicted transcriptional regulator